jgi:pyrroline-5-carboxylate reductase
LVVWAVKPQTFKEAAAQAQPHLAGALHLSVAAGITSDSIAAWLGHAAHRARHAQHARLGGLGHDGLFARPGVPTMPTARWWKPW